MKRHWETDKNLAGERTGYAVTPILDEMERVARACKAATPALVLALIARLRLADRLAEAAQELEQANIERMAFGTEKSLPWVRAHKKLGDALAAYRELEAPHRSIPTTHNARESELLQRIREVEAERDKLRSVCAEAYQLAGAYDAPVEALDNLLCAAKGKPLLHETFLPVENQWERQLADAQGKLEAAQGRNHRTGSGNP